MKRTRARSGLSAALAALAALAAAAPAAAQQSGSPVGLSGLVTDLARMEELRGSVPARTSVLQRHSETASGIPAIGFDGRADHVGDPGIVVGDGDAHIRLLPVEVFSSYNSGWADDRDNGLEWSGRGASGHARAGVAARWRWFSAAFQPEVAFWQNEEHDIRVEDLIVGEFGNAFYRLDLPQRFGDDGATIESLGQSYVRVDVGPASAGFSNENLWSGPAAKYPIILGNSAPGFPHVFVGTNRPVDLWITRIEARAIVGWTEESDFYDADESNDFSNLFGWGVSLRPRGLEWLEVGLQRTLHYPVAEQFDYEIDQLFGFLQPSVEHRVGDELASAYFRAVLPADEIEFYGEWARTDRFATWLEDFVPEPDHSQGYLFGLQKLVRLEGDARIRLMAELVDLQEQGERREGAGRPMPVFYGNSQQGRGHTHRGQILGASTGPGSDAQTFALDWIDAERNVIGGWFERVRRNDAESHFTGAMYAERESFPFRHDVELTGGVRALRWFGDVSVSGALSWSRRYNRVFITPTDDNVRFSLDAAWWPGGSPFAR